LAQASADLEDASAAYRATDARVTSEQALLLEELAEANSIFALRSLQTMFVVIRIDGTPTFVK